MKPRACHCLRAVALLASLPAIAGCETGGGARMRMEPIAFPAPQMLPRVLVYGSLSELLPRYDRTPLLEQFLYGPNDYGKTALRNPQGMTQLRNLLLVCDQGRPDVVSINLSNGQSMLWSDPAHPPRCPVDVCVDTAGLVFVADTTYRSVLVYGTDRKKFLEELKPSHDAAPAFRPAAVHISKGILYVGNIGDHQIDGFDLTRRTWLDPLKPRPDQSQLIAPTGIDVNSDGVVHIVDAVQAMVLRFGPDGKWLPPIGRPGRGRGEFVRPKQICCTCGLVLVTDAGRQSVLVFRSDGSFLTEIHESPPGWPGFTLPAGIVAVHRDSIAGLETAGEDRSEADEYVVVSDSLGGVPLILLGVVATRKEIVHGG